MTENILKPEPYRITDIICETEIEYTFRVETDLKPDHGQFFQISLPMVGEAPISVSGIGEHWLDFTIRKVGEVTNVLFAMKPGDKLFMRGPYGTSFPVDDFKNKDLVVIAGGTGVSPVRSTLEYFYDNPGEVNSLYFLAGFKNRGSILFDEDLTRFAEKFNTTYTLDHDETERFKKGFVTEYINDVPFAKFADFNVITVGPEIMMNAAIKECLDQGVNEDKIWVSIERKMSCAVGKCGHCRIGDTYVCLDGPIFNYAAARHLLD